MSDNSSRDLWTLMRSLFTAHPWHGIPMGDDAPEKVTTYIEIVPSDTVKYEIDKQTGHLKVDRPQKYSSLCPTLYGFIPQTYCAEQVGEMASEKIGRPGIYGDGDPIDICVLSEKEFSHGDFLVQAIPIGGIRMIDKNEADDKIIAVMENDAIYGNWRNVDEVPGEVIDRLTHYFQTYKDPPGGNPRRVEITHVYGREEAYEVIRRSIADYEQHFGDLADTLEQMLLPDKPMATGDSAG